MQATGFKKTKNLFGRSDRRPKRERSSLVKAGFFAVLDFLPFLGELIHNKDGDG